MYLSKASTWSPVLRAECTRLNNLGDVDFHLFTLLFALELNATFISSWRPEPASLQMRPSQAPPTSHHLPGWRADSQARGRDIGPICPHPDFKTHCPSQLCVCATWQGTQSLYFWAFPRLWSKRVHRGRPLCRHKLSFLGSTFGLLFILTPSYKSVSIYPLSVNVPLPLGKE